MKYKLLYADPPWSFTNNNTGGNMNSGASAHYPTMNINDLKALNVPSICDDDCLLTMWWVGSQPQEAIDLCHAWGFTIKNMNGFVWNKLTAQHNPHFGMGYYTRAGSESAIIATRGKPEIVDRAVRAVHSEKLTDLSLIGSYPVTTHSTKPPEFRNKCVELMGDVPRLEMFARTRTEGWDVFGNEVEGSVTIDSYPVNGKEYHIRTKYCSYTGSFTHDRFMINDHEDYVMLDDVLVWLEVDVT